MEKRFADVFSTFCWDDISERISKKTSGDVESALSKNIRNLEDFTALISPAATPYLEDIANLSHSLTTKRFGKTIQLYIPLYLSNECHNFCTYCGFSIHNSIPRLTLNDEQILDEVKAVKKLGYDHVLLVTGESNKNVGVDYFERVIRLIRPQFSNIAAEVQPLSTQDYQRLIRLGLDTVCIYQETYNRESYKKHHLKGKKTNFEYRLETPDRLGEASIHRIGLGALIGLSDWRTDAFFVALHLSYLKKTYWKTRFSISFPRLRPAAGFPTPEVQMSERELVQLICAYRLFDENVELSLSTRERLEFRDHAIKLGITSMSAGSKTEPGGYALGTEALEQFAVADERSPEEIANMIRGQGQEAVFKDWDPTYNE